jgi:hypothetical protein
MISHAKFQNFQKPVNANNQLSTKDKQIRLYAVDILSYKQHNKLENPFASLKHSYNLFVVISPPPAIAKKCVCAFYT